MKKNLLHEQHNKNKMVILFLNAPFCLYRRLEIDPELRELTHIVVDEVHERSEDSDFLLMILRDTLKKVGFYTLSIDVISIVIRIYIYLL